MEQSAFEKMAEELRKQLDTSRQYWLFGAGISCLSNIPLMYSLTERIESIITESRDKKNNEIFNDLKSELDESSHIEHYLSHLGDLMALANRAKSKSTKLSDHSFTYDELEKLYTSIIKEIGEIIRYGYSKKEGKEEIGTCSEPIVQIEYHLNFVKAIFSNRSNLLSRSKIVFFTTNYDTLLEDALGLEKHDVVDGFSGGAVGFWNPQVEFQETNLFPQKCLLYKLHGSIDWHKDKERGLVRARYGTSYLSEPANIMIYPQATKYIETQKDPFFYLFTGFRTALNIKEDHILVTCGYSFGDEHINTEIENALLSFENKTTLIAFIQEKPEEDVVINKTLDTWLQNSSFGDRIYVAGQKGIYYNSLKPITPEDNKNLSWWTFSGLTNFIMTGEYE